MCSVPPRGIASRALTARFITTCPIWAASLRNFFKSLANVNSNRISGPIKRRTRSCMFETVTFKSTVCVTVVCRRLNASSCWVRPEARSAARRISLAARSCSDRSGRISISSSL